MTNKYANSGWLGRTQSSDLADSGILAQSVAIIEPGPGRLRLHMIATTNASARNHLINPIGLLTMLCRTPTT